MVKLTTNVQLVTHNPSSSHPPSWVYIYHANTCVYVKYGVKVSYAPWKYLDVRHPEIK